MHKFVSYLLLLIPFFSFSQANYAITSIPAELIKDANSVLVKEFIEVDVSEEAKVIRKSERVITVLNELGNKKLNIKANYDDEAKVKKIEAYVYNALGEEIEHFKKRDFKDVSTSDGFSLYRDDRVLYLDYTPTTYPYTVVFTKTIVSNTTAFIPKWFPFEGYAISTKESTYILKFSPSNKPRFKAMNLEGHDVSVSENPSKIICKAKNLKAAKYEAYSLPFRKTAPQVLFSLDRFHLKGVPGYGKDWEGFGKWMQNHLLNDVRDLPEATISKVKTMVSGETSNIAKARKIYQYLQDKVRYISVQIGVGGWKPMLASDVDKLSYGDCKALSNYTKTLLDAVGVPSYYTILYAGNEEQDITEDFSSIQGNHAILGIPEGDEIIWLECTSQNTPFGFGGNFSDDRDVLIITPEGGKIVHTKKYTFKDNVQENTGVININEKGGMNAILQVVSKGLQYDNKYRLEKETKEDLIKSYKERWDYINGLSVESTIIENDKNAIVFSEKLTVKSPNYCSSIGSDLLLCLNVFNQSQHVPSRIPNRKRDLFISEGYTDKDLFEITLPNGYTYESLPENKVIENKFGSYAIEFKELSDNKIQYKRTLIIKKGTFPPEEYKNYRSFRRTIAKLDKTKILLSPKK